MRSTPAKARREHHRRICAVEVSPSEVDAGTEMTAAVRVCCPHGCDLKGQSVSIQNQEGAELASAELGEFDGEVYGTGAFALQTPLKVSQHTYRAVLAPHEYDGVWHEETSTEFTFATKAHAASVSVWGMPSAIAAGERFKLKVGVKCSSACKLTGTPLSIFDHQGEKVGAGILLDEVWPGTSALYFSEVEAKAPAAVGDYEWRVKTPASASEPSHAGGSFTFTIRVVGPPDHAVTVVAFDGETQAPINGAHVLLHPYRSRTDETGVAKIKVTKGSYRLVVSGFNYIPYENNIDVAGDTTTRVELMAEPDGQEDYR